MGNNASAEGGGGRSGPRFMRTGALGLSKSEVEERCQPSGLYPSWQWEDRVIRKLIADGKLAARLKGTDGRRKMTDHECPICFLHYSQVNVTTCCQADICTECYLQVKPQKAKSTACPFCNSPQLKIKVQKTMDTAAVEERQLNEQKVIEAQIRATTQTTDEDSFGSSLEQNTAVRLMRARSESVSSAGDAASDENVASLAMTPEDRHVLEQEIRAQHTHPLARQVEQEAEEQRLENERNYYRSHSRARSVARMSSDSTLLANRNSRNWNEIVQAFETGGNGSNVNTLDDLVVLEAAILLSMAEEDRRRDHQDTNEDTARFDASQHARQGFPLVQSLLNEQHSARNVARPSRARSQQSLQHGNMSSNLLLRGISEAEQIEMAIAMSLQQSQQQQQQQESTSNDETEENEAQTLQGVDASSRVSSRTEVSASDGGAAESSSDSTSSSDEGSNVASGEDGVRAVESSDGSSFSASTSGNEERSTAESNNADGEVVATSIDNVQEVAEGRNNSSADGDSIASGDDENTNLAGGQVGNLRDNQEAVGVATASSNVDSEATEVTSLRETEPAIGVDAAAPNNTDNHEAAFERVENLQEPTATDATDQGDGGEETNQAACD